MFKKVFVIQVLLEFFLVVGFSSIDSLMVFNVFEIFYQFFKDVVINLWFSGIQKWFYKDEVLLIKFIGNLWCVEGVEVVYLRVML